MFVVTCVNFAVACLFLVPPVGAQESYYRGKTVTFLVGAPPGGGFDTMTRIVARHLGRNIPGNPIVVVQNMPGAGTVIAANHLYNRSKPDGLTIGVWVGSLTLQKMLGGTGIGVRSAQVRMDRRAGAADHAVRVYQG